MLPNNIVGTTTGDAKLVSTNRTFDGGVSGAADNKWRLLRVRRNFDLPRPSLFLRRFSITIAWLSFCRHCCIDCYHRKQRSRSVLFGETLRALRLRTVPKLVTRQSSEILSRAVPAHYSKPVRQQTASENDSCKATCQLPTISKIILLYFLFCISGTQNKLPYFQ